ncbi:cytochrome c oxidase accessory protein CcoG [Pannonibacter phragmitetus]|uniref:cytochrome c oxidase accessory protein CcoG n=1 Tax=Pannonibacter phragmitetus TaxID=121719 RepID=UPI000F44A1F7|nr:cytochrome c oxidase accessory protein CcoG [Pannonibacter phragmitetus]MBA4207624.1 cytochrome c oxidase accessory protein CcoG [Polymorphum sp.]
MTYQIIPPLTGKPVTGKPIPARPPRPQGLPAANGTRVIPQAVKGKFRTLKWRLLVLCLAVYYVLPFLRWGRGPGLPDQAVLFDLANVRFYVFFIEIRAQELYYLTGLLVLATLILVLMNALAGRVWCGFFCPQTIWTDLFLLVERKFEGDRRQQMQALKQPLTLSRLWRKTAKHVVWLGIAAATGGAFVLYFADAPTLLRSLASGEAPLLAYSMVLTLTFTTYCLAGLAREKVCTFMCPWPRLQGAIWDAQALTVNYRPQRGEPRMSAKKAATAREMGLPAGDCVDCNACVAVCPMGIDIRQGPSIACINCGLCVDACDSTMFRLDRLRGLIDYESWTNIEREMQGKERQPVRLLRPKVLAIALAALALAAGMAIHLSGRATLALAVIHERTPAAVQLSDGQIRNAYEVRITNTTGEAALIRLSATGAAPLTLASPGLEPDEDGSLAVDLAADGSRKLRVTLTGSRKLAGDIRFTLQNAANGGEAATASRFFLP